MESSTPPRDTAWAMSKENVEVVRRFYDRLNAGDPEGMIELCDARFVMDMTQPCSIRIAMRGQTASAASTGT